MQQEILFGIYAEVRETRAELRAHRENSDERNRSIHKRLDRVEDHFRSEVKEIRAEMKPQAAQTSNLTFWSVAGVLLRHWNPILAVVAVGLSLFGIVMPEKVQSILGLAK